MFFSKIRNFKVIFHFYFFNMDISLNICFSGLKFVMVVHNIPLEGTVSQISDLGLSFDFM